MNTKVKSNRRKKQARFMKKMQKTAFVSGITAIIALCSTITAFAKPPQGADTTTMNSLVGIVMWVLRGIILFVCVVPGLIKFGQGQANEDERARNTGLSIVAVGGVIITATFAVEPILTGF